MHNLHLILLWLLLKQSCSLKFTIIHNNDMHARYEPIAADASLCRKGDDERGYCFGGFARVATAVDQERAKGSVIFLNAGDTYQGTPWYTIYKGSLAAELINMLAPDALSLGNHEFDDNIAGLMPFLNGVKYPVVCCNLQLDNVPEMQQAKQLVTSTVITKFEQKIGIVGYLTPDTKELTQSNNLEFYQEISAINNEASKLVAAGVGIIIALGHSGYRMDQQIAKECPDVDVVVGGHSHSFLYSGNLPDIDKPIGPYPTIMTKPNGVRVPVVQAYAYTKYLGKLDVEFDNLGHLISYSGTPILLDKSIEGRADIKALLERKRGPITEMEEQVVGTTMVYLSGHSTCRQEECNLGNLIADSYVYARVLEGKGGQYWTDASIAFINGGGIRASINPDSSGAITFADVATVLPFGNTLHYTKITGKQLMDVLELAADLRPRDSNGGFLQMSGIRVKFNYSRGKGKRVVSLFALCAACKIPFYEKVDSEKYYGVIVPSFLLNGGDGHKLVDPDVPETEQMQMLDREALIKFFQEHKVVYPKLEDRISTSEVKAKSYSTRACGESFIVVISLLVNVYLLREMM